MELGVEGAGDTSEHEDRTDDRQSTAWRKRSLGDEGGGGVSESSTPPPAAAAEDEEEEEDSDADLAREAAVEAAVWSVVAD